LVDRRRQGSISAPGTGLESPAAAFFESEKTVSPPPVSGTAAFAFTANDSFDIGADNGIISLLLRERGGRWYSADLDEKTVQSIQSLVDTDVYQIDGLRTPFTDEHFDLVVIVDFLEHIETDKEFVLELHRILRPGANLIVNVPLLRPASLLNRFRHAIGLTDEKHGHVRPGYDAQGLAALFGTRFKIENTRTYSGFFTELLDTGLNFTYEQLAQRRRRDAPRSQKGTVLTGEDVEKDRKRFALLAFLYPFFWIFSKLDSLLFFQRGYKLIVQATARK